MPGPDPAQARIACATDAELAELGRLLFPDAPTDRARVRAAVLRLYAIRMDPEEWCAFLEAGTPAALLLDAQDLAILGELVRREGLG